MRKLFITISIIFAVLGVILSILPTEKLGLIPVVLSIVLAFLALKKSDDTQKKLPQFILIFTTILLVIALVKITLTIDEVVIDQKDEIIKIESQKQDVKDLEELDGLE